MRWKVIPEDLCPQGGLDYEEAKRIAAVIEAAKALHAKMSRGEFASTANEQALVWQAVEALQEVERCETGTTPTR